MQSIVYSAVLFFLSGPLLEIAKSLYAGGWMEGGRKEGILVYLIVNASHWKEERFYTLFCFCLVLYWKLCLLVYGKYTFSLHKQYSKKWQYNKFHIMSITKQ